MDGSWTTAAVEPRRQFSMWREITRQSFAPLEADPDAEGAFAATASICTKGRARFSRVEAEGHRVRQTRASVAGVAGGFSAKLVMRHHIRAEQFGEDVVLEPGDIALIDLAAPCTISFPEGCSLLGIVLPDESVRCRLGPRGRPSSLRVSGNGLGALIGSYLRGLWELSGEDVADVDDMVIDHLGALFGRAAHSHSPEPARQAIRRVTCQRILAEIAANLADPSLSAERVAARLRISRSHLYALMVESGMNFAGYLREQRLQAARRYLASDRFRGARIADIAMHCGYSDAASFTRAYGRRFGHPPTATQESGAAPSAPGPRWKP